MKRLIGLLVIGLLAIMANQATAADLFSVRCESDSPDRPYFATFGLDTKAVVFETPPLTAETHADSNVRVGEVTSSVSDGMSEIQFMLRVPGGRLDLVFNRSKNTMTWPGIGSGSFRPTLIHKCQPIPPRSILSFRVRDPIENPVSVRCEDAGNIYFTMDVASKQAIYERGAEGRIFTGRVTNALNQDEVRLLMDFDQPRDVVWNKPHQTITIAAIEGDPSSPRTELQCQQVTSRTMMIYHARLWRR